MFFSFWVLELDFPVCIEILREQNFAKGGTRNVYSRKNRGLKNGKAFTAKYDDPGYEMF